MLHIPNAFTILRSITSFLLVFLIFINNNNIYYLMMYLLIFVSTTDIIDGIYSRIFNLESHFGEILDQISDKVMVILIFVFITYYHYSSIETLIIILCREMIMSSIREYMGNSELKSNKVLLLLCKIKTNLQILSIIILLLTNKIIDMKYLSFIILITSNIITTITGIYYIFKYVNKILN